MERTEETMPYLRCWAEVSLDAIRHNIQAVRERIPGSVKLLAVVKANAYGHGAVQVSRALQDLADYYAVAALEEALELREAGIEKPILILGYTSPSAFAELLAADVRPAIWSIEDARLLSRAAEKAGTAAKVHVALDTGMTRIGFPVTEEEDKAIRKWQETHLREKHPEALEDPSYFGAIGGNWTYKFIPTSIGTIGEVKCSCGEKYCFSDLF